MNRFRKGDHVRVKDEATLRAEIARDKIYVTHDDDGDWFTCARGLSWMPEMWAYCGMDFILLMQDGDDSHWWKFVDEQKIGRRDAPRAWLFDEDWLEPYEPPIDIGDIGGLL